MCGGGEKSGFPPEMLLIMSVHIGCVSCGRTDWVGLLMPQ